MLYANAVNKAYLYYQQLQINMETRNFNITTKYHVVYARKKRLIPKHFLPYKHFLPPDTHMYVSVSEGKKCSFFEKFGVLCFLETPVLRFALLPYYRQVI